MSDSVYDILSPYLQFTEKSKPDLFENKDSIQKSWQDKPFQKYQPDTSFIELNSADSSSLLSLNGIGPSYAGRIIRYRDRLGGFYRPEQLFEIKGIDSARFELFSKRIATDPSLIRKINLNTVTFKELLKHPYFEYYLVKAIFSKKDEVRSFDSVGQIRYLPVMYEELYLNIMPYLEVE